MFTSFPTQPVRTPKDVLAVDATYTETQKQTISHYSQIHRSADTWKRLNKEISDARSQFANVREVDEGCFLCSHSHYLRGFHDKLPLLSCHHVGILLSHDVKDTT